MILAYHDWTYEQVFNAVKNADEVTLDCEHCSLENMGKVVKWLKNAGYMAKVSSDWKRIYVSRVQPEADYEAFAKWVAKEVMDEEYWGWNSGAFPELACRKLNKLGIVDADGNYWVYADESLEQKSETDVLNKIKTEIEDTGAYEQEIHGQTEFLKGINYCLGIIDKHKAESEDKE